MTTNGPLDFQCARSLFTETYSVQMTLLMGVTNARMAQPYGRRTNYWQLHLDSPRGVRAVSDSPGENPVLDHGGTMRESLSTATTLVVQHLVLQAMHTSKSKINNLPSSWGSGESFTALEMGLCITHPSIE